MTSDRDFSNEFVLIEIEMKKNELAKESLNLDFLFKETPVALNSITN